MKLLKNASAQQSKSSRLDVEVSTIATQNRLIAKARWEAKKQKIRHSIPLPKEIFPPLIEHSKFYEFLADNSEL